MQRIAQLSEMPLVSVDDLLGYSEKSGRLIDSERLGGSAIHGQFKCGGLLDGKIRWFRSLEYLVRVDRRTTIEVRDIRAVGNEAADFDKLPSVIHRGQPVFCGKVDEKLSRLIEHGTWKLEQGIGVPFCHIGKCALEVIGTTCLDQLQPQAQTCRSLRCLLQHA